jgi:glycosyltransferase involved in cell wall biosynthesis
LDAKNKRYRISFIIGSLAQGGAEKQLLYILHSLKEQGNPIQALLLSRSEHYEQALKELEIPTVPITQGPVFQRLYRVIEEIKRFQPDYIQATHFFASFYAGASGRFLHIPSIGAIRGDFHHDLAGVNRMSRLLLNLPTVYAANSINAQQNAVSYGLDPRKIFLLGNVIDIQDFDQKSMVLPEIIIPPQRIIVTVVARLIKVKRLERFIIALAQARHLVPDLFGAVIGDGPEKDRLVGLASHLGLLGTKKDSGICFYGARSDVPQLLKQSDIFVLTSDQEGFPNVLLEAMAASLPIISTPAGEAPQLIDNGVNGYIVPFDDITGLKSRIIDLAISSSMRRKLGANSRKKVSSDYDLRNLDTNLDTLYENIRAYLQGQQIKQKHQTQGMSKQA